MAIGIFAGYFEGVPNSRIERHKRYSLLDMLFISVCAVMCGTKSFVDIADFGVAREEWLRRRLELGNGIPSHDAFRRVLSLVDPDALLGCFISWTGRLSEVTSGDIVALGGKTLRRSFQEAARVGAVHVLNAFSSANGLCLGQVKVDEKSNEITAVPALTRDAGCFGYSCDG